jgi:hypothetical protein
VGSGLDRAAILILANRWKLVLRARCWKKTRVEVTNIEFVAITNDVLADVGKHYLTVWMRGDVHDVHAEIGDSAEITQLGWFAPDRLPRPLHNYFQNLIEGRCCPFPCKPAF